MQLTKINLKSRQVCIGDLNKRVTIHTRSMQSPIFQGTDLTEKFSPSQDVWAAVSTTKGKTLFTDVNVDVSISHVIYIRYRADVNAESWIEYNGRYYDIIDCENMNESDEFLKLLCNERGDKNLAGSHA